MTTRRHLRLVPTPVDPAEVYRRCAPLADAEGDLTAVIAEVRAALRAVGYSDAEIDAQMRAERVGA